MPKDNHFDFHLLNAKLDVTGGGCMLGMGESVIILDRKIKNNV